MANFAKIEKGIVTNVVVVDNEHEENGQDYLNSIGLDGVWIQTSYNANFRKKYAGLGDRYDETADAFKPSQTSPNLIWDEESWSWVLP
jgi:hypothetical protein